MGELDEGLQAECGKELKVNVRFDPVTYAERILQAYEAGKITERIRDALLLALDNRGVEELVVGDTKVAFPPCYLQSVELGLDIVRAFYLERHTGNVHVDNRGESPPERYRDTVPAEGGNSSRLADRAGGAREGEPAAGKLPFVRMR